MFKKTFFTKRTITLVILVFIISVLSILFQSSIIKSQQEHYIFCEGGLKPTMDKFAVLSYLQNFGDISYGTLKTGSHEEEIYVGYHNKNIGDKTYIVFFVEGKYREVRALPSFFDFQEAGTTVAVCKE